MKSLYKQNLLKSGWVMVNSEEVRVIDSNKAIEEKISSPAYADPDGDVAAYQPAAFDGDGAMPSSVDMLFAEGLDAEVVQADQVTIGQEQIEGARQQAEEIIAQAHAQAQEIVEQARIMSEQDARGAYENAKTQGMQDGYQQGIQKANAEAEAVRNEYRMKEQELLQQYERKLEEMEPHLIQELTGIYEHVFAVELSQYRNILQHLIANTLRTVEMSDNYLIHVSEQDYSYVSMQKAQIIEEGCIKNAAVEIVEDRTLAKNECMIETADGIFDCSLSVQLTELKRKLQLLSYTGKKE
ncbi:MAG: hypothetical protein E7289_08280 [Lachnospiraceae bacterium]|nr:hypothetical protein [Lachnospiraceae bacterium]